MDGTIDANVVADVYMKNYFNTVEWASARPSLRRHFSEASPTVEWEQREAGTTFLQTAVPFLSTEAQNKENPSDRSSPLFRLPIPSNLYVIVVSFSKRASNGSLTTVS